MIKVLICILGERVEFSSFLLARLVLCCRRWPAGGQIV